MMLKITLKDQSNGLWEYDTENHSEKCDENMTLMSTNTEKKNTIFEQIIVRQAS